MKNTILKDGLALWNQEITKQQESDFHTYMQHLLEKNKVMNLTNITEENEIYTEQEPVFPPFRLKSCDEI